jgi:hypothetical protein
MHDHDHDHDHDSTTPSTDGQDTPSRATPRKPDVDKHPPRTMPDSELAAREQERQLETGEENPA